MRKGWAWPEEDNSSDKKETMSHKSHRACLLLGSWESFNTKRKIIILYSKFYWEVQHKNYMKCQSPLEECIKRLLCLFYCLSRDPINIPQQVLVDQKW
jgi:hypothetical protein